MRSWITTKALAALAVMLPRARVFKANVKEIFTNNCMEVRNRNSSTGIGVLGYFANNNRFLYKENNVVAITGADRIVF